MAVTGNGGVGDAADFMNVVTDANGSVETNIDTPVVQRLFPEPSVFEQGSPESVIAGIVLGPFAAPALGVVASTISSIFDFL